jgi:hypothetical protein
MFCTQAPAGTSPERWRDSSCELNVLLTVHRSVSVQWNQRNAFFIQFIENQGPLHASSITCSFSGGATQTAVKLQSWHSQLTLYARNIPSAVCAAPPENEQLMLETCRGPWFSINWTKSASRWFHYTDIQAAIISVIFCNNQLVELTFWGIK